ncbi:uncharacterized protein DDB_G0283697 [Chelonus insularis]|uniref:uncharacterized protein DDB_G0283697 n=1 Tax=Chelonus insularis TaxID=460826 RepID=UPI0015885D20|nr:uncharacterized protein DDB_G0283697 [Chelonus insularis]
MKKKFITMKRFYLIFMLLLLRETNSRPLRKDPAFAKPVYSNSYLPAAMQVIFYAVEQLKAFQNEEPEPITTVISTTIPTTMSHEPGQHQPKPTEAVIQQFSTEKPALSQEASVVELETSNTNESTPSSNHEMPELGEETPEANYGTPEINHEMPEEIHETQEVNQENPLPEKNEEKPESNSNDKFQTTTIANDDVSQQDSQSSSSSSSEEKQSENEKNKREPTVDSVVKEIYGIMKPQDNSQDSSVKSESKKSKKPDNDSEEDEEEDDDNDDNRFTLLGEKVSQVPRPSLSNYLRRSSKTPPKCSIQQLALLYDALSKDARKQGFAKFSGYSDEVLKTLQASAEGGIGPQLQKLLEKILERNEVTRDDAKVKVVEMLKELNNPGSEINRDLRRLLPLRFNP